jgi:3-methyladenine DNA glycosylase AlkD
MALVERIREALRAVADPTLALGQQAYMKSAMPFLGVRMPAVRATVRATSRDADAAVLLDAALTLWREARFREERYAALAVMGLSPLRGDVALLNVHEEMVRTGAWWDLVDEVAHRLRELFDVDPLWMAVGMRVWADDDDMWVRRAAIISQLGRRSATDRDVLEYAILASIADRQFFLRKAIGWALRDLGRHDPDWVRTFVSQHPELSALSRREALKHLG